MNTETFNKIIPGKTYPTSVTIMEDFEGEQQKVQFFLNSYFVGMYCAIHANGELVNQMADHNNKEITRKIKKDIKSAIARGAKVEIGSIHEVNKEMV